MKGLCANINLRNLNPLKQYNNGENKKKKNKTVIALF